MLVEIKGVVVAQTKFPVKEGKKPFCRVSILSRYQDRADIAMVMMPVETAPKIDSAVTITAKVEVFEGRLSVMAV